jgi:hypothetical protein
MPPLQPRILRCIFSDQKAQVPPPGAERFDGKSSLRSGIAAYEADIRALSQSMNFER